VSSFLFFILISILLVRSRFCYVMKSRWLQFLYILRIFLYIRRIFFSSPRTRKLLYQLWNIKSPESLHTFENPYSTSEKRVREFLSCKIVLYFFSATPQSAGPVPPKTTLRAQRRKCVVKYLTWSIPSPPPAANPFLCRNPSHLTLALPPFSSPFLSLHPRWLDS